MIGAFLRFYNRVGWFFLSATATPKQNPMDIVGKKENMKIAELGKEAGSTSTGPMAEMIYFMTILIILGCMITVLIAIGKNLLGGGGREQSGLKSAIGHKLLVVILAGCGFAFLNLIRKVVIELVLF